MILESLAAEGVKFAYEPFKIKYQKKPSLYTPDLVLENGIIVELKGYFDSEDRAKHLLLREQHPNLDIRFVFYNAKTKIHKLSSTTYGDWADAHGITYANKELPIEWATEPARQDNKQVREDKKPKQRRSTSKHSA